MNNQIAFQKWNVIQYIFKLPSSYTGGAKRSSGVRALPQEGFRKLLHVPSKDRYFPTKQVGGKGQVSCSKLHLVSMVCSAIPACSGESANLKQKILWMISTQLASLSAENYLSCKRRAAFTTKSALSPWVRDISNGAILSEWVQAIEFSFIVSWLRFRFSSIFIIILFWQKQNESMC